VTSTCRNGQWIKSKRLHSELTPYFSRLFQLPVTACWSRVILFRSTVYVICNACLYTLWSGFGCHVTWPHIILTSSRHWLQQYFYHNPRGNDQSGRYNGIIWSFVKLALKSHKLHILQWEIVLPSVLQSIHSWRCTITNEMSHERLFKHKHWSSFGVSIPTCWAHQVMCRDRPIFGFYQYIGIGQNGRISASIGVDKTLLYSSRIQTTCTKKHNESSQDSYLTTTLAGAVS